MKAIICGAKGDLHLTSFGTTWTSCQCGNVRVKWLDANAGTVVVAARSREAVRLLGLNNRYLIGAFEPNMAWTDYQQLHKEATEAPGYIFDVSRAACWAVMIPVGRSNDVRWATDEEHEEAFATTTL